MKSKKNTKSFAVPAIISTAVWIGSLFLLHKVYGTTLPSILLLLIAISYLLFYYFTLSTKKWKLYFIGSLIVFVTFILILIYSPNTYHMIFSFFQ